MNRPGSVTSRCRNCFGSNRHQASSCSAWIWLSGNLNRITSALLPPTTAYGGTSRVTMEPAATTAPSPIVTPGLRVTSWAIHTSLPMVGNGWVRPCFGLGGAASSSSPKYAPKSAPPRSYVTFDDVTHSHECLGPRTVRPVAIEQYRPTRSPGLTPEREYENDPIGHSAFPP